MVRQVDLDCSFGQHVYRRSVFSSLLEHGLSLSDYLRIIKINLNIIMPNPVKLESEVLEIVNYGDRIYSVKFQLLNGIARFKPGQFLHLTLDKYDPSEGYWPESRVFSIASMPGEKYIEILYSVKGKYTERMSRELSLGRSVWLKLPYGDFIIDNHLDSTEKIVLIAGGTGISPFIPFLKNYAAGFYKIPAVLYYGIRNDKFFLYGDAVKSLKNKIEVNVISGIMDVGDISGRISKFKNAKCFVSGPPAMIKAFREGLASEGLPEESVIIDAWD